MPVVTLISRPGCHLCDEAREAVTGVVDGLGGEASVTVSELSIDGDAALEARYSDEVPVVLVDDRVHAVWRVDPERLRAALLHGADREG